MFYELFWGIEGRAMNIHFLIDNQYTKRFVMYMNEHYAEDKNRFYVVNYKKKLQFLDGIPNVNVISGTNQNIIWDIRKIVHDEECTNIFIHYLSNIYLFPLFFKKKKQKTYWMTWGGDYYSYINFPLFDKETAKIVSINEKKRIIDKLLNIFRNYVIKHKVDYVSISPYEYDILTSYYKIQPKRINFKYPNPVTLKIEKEYKELSSKKEKIILVGNSGAAENNHIDAFLKLSKLTGSFKLIVPLSYAYEENYREKVISMGRTLFGDKFIPLLDYMTPEHYYEILLTVDVAVMNHFRQQAAGNMRTLIELGKKIYINETNPLYHTFIQNNVYLSPMPKDYFDESIFIEYSEAEKKQNIKGLESFYSEEIIAKYMDALFM